MTKSKAFGLTLLALAGMTSSSMGQAPDLAGGAAAPAAAAPAAGATGAAGGGMNIFSLLGIDCDKIAACKAKICAKPCGRFLNNLTKPLVMASGGLINPCCPEVSNNPAVQAAEEAQGGAEGLAAKIKREEADAKKRRAAVRYLGTVDCHYYFEVEEQLILSLRTDRNECVRWEAAMALGNGCCCTKKTMNALMNTIICSKEDNPKLFVVETSERVKMAAYVSLHHCLQCYREIVPAADPKRQPEPAPTPGPKTTSAPGALPIPGTVENTHLFPGVTQAAAYSKQLDAIPMSVMVERARKVVADYKPAYAGGAMPPPGNQSLFQIAGLVPVENSGPKFGSADEAMAMLGGHHGEVVQTIATDAPGEVIRVEMVQESGEPPMHGVKPATFHGATRVEPVEVTGTLVRAKTVPVKTVPVKTVTVQTVPAKKAAATAPTEKTVPATLPSVENAQTVPTAPAPKPASAATSAAVPAKSVTQPKPVVAPAAGKAAVPTTPAKQEAAKSILAVEPVTSTSTLTAPSVTPAKPVVTAPAKPVVAATPVVPAKATTTEVVKPASAVTTAVPATVTPAIQVRPAATKSAPVQVAMLTPQPAPRSSPAQPPVSLTTPAPKASTSPKVDVPVLLTVLQRSVNPFQREWAAEILSTADWQAHPEVLSVLLQSAREDRAPAVRAACARSVMAKNAASPEAIGTLQAMTHDTDPQVQQAAHQALTKLTAPTARRAN